MEMTVWQPIETAPKDGVSILLKGAGGGEVEGKWTKSDDAYGADEKFPCGWYTAYTPNEIVSILSGFDHKEPTHWMPLPEPPQ